MTTRPTITAAIITLDEAENLAALLPRLDWVDEVVVVDGGSCDDTVSVARRHGCHVVSRGFDSFARQRNVALRLARTDWVLSIDADERPSPRLAEEVRRRVATVRHDGFRVRIRSRLFGRPVRRSGTQDDNPVRLVRRGRGRWVGDVHEVLHVPGRVSQLTGWFEHHTQESLHVFLKKMHCYTTLEAGARVRAGYPPRRRDLWLAPPREVFRRLIWKQGLLDGPEGWAFCLLSGLCEWVLAEKQRRAWGVPG